MLLYMWAKGALIKLDAAFIGFASNPSMPHALFLFGELMMLYISVSQVGSKKMGLNMLELMYDEQLWFGGEVAAQAPEHNKCALNLFARDDPLYWTPSIINSDGRFLIPLRVGSLTALQTFTGSLNMEANLFL